MDTIDSIQHKEAGMRSKWIILAMAALLIPGTLWAALKVGDEVEIKGKTNGTWFPGTIAEIKGDAYFFKWAGWEGSDLVETDKAHLRPYPKVGAVTVRKGGSLWASVAADGAIRVGGSIVGKFSEDGTVRKMGNIVGSVELNGDIRKGGNIVGKIETLGDLRRSGNIIGNVEAATGAIRNGGNIWGKIEKYSMRFRDLRAATVLLVFFDTGFGY
jgi:hypothetical protein